MRPAALLLLLLLGCRNERAQLTEEMIVHPGASNVRSQVADGVQRLSYRVDAPYPADAVITRISDTLALAGWQPTRNNFFNRDELSHYVLGWEEAQTWPPGAKGPESYICAWLGQWVHANGRMVSYTLIYKSPSTAFTNRNQLEVEVLGLDLPAAEKMAATGKQQPMPKLEVLPVATPPSRAIRRPNPTM